MDIQDLRGSVGSALELSIESSPVVIASMRALTIAAFHIYAN